MPVWHGTIWRIRVSAVLWPGTRDETHTRSFYLNHCWVVLFSEISQCSISDILPKHRALSNGRKVKDVFPSDSVLKFSDLRRAFTRIWNSLPAKPDAPRTSGLCEEALSYVSSHLYYCVFADLLYALRWLALFVCLKPWRRMNPPLNIHGINAEKLITLKLYSGFTWLLCEREQLW